eukprot:Platyproteum_vivax@DN1549_c0_g1_i1.p1
MGQGSYGLKCEKCGFTPAELPTIRQLYAYFCLNRVSLRTVPLTLTQFISIMCPNEAKARNSVVWKMLFNGIDTNQDKVIDFEEFVCFVSIIKRGRSIHHNLLFFAIFDTNRDRFITKQSFIRLQEFSKLLLNIYALKVMKDEKLQSHTNKIVSKLKKFCPPRVCQSPRCAVPEMKVVIEDWPVLTSNEDAINMTQKMIDDTFSLLDGDHDGRFNMEDMKRLCQTDCKVECRSFDYKKYVYPRYLIMWITALFEYASEETGIVIDFKSVVNEKPEMNWREEDLWEDWEEFYNLYLHKYSVYDAEEEEAVNMDEFERVRCLT